MLTDMHINYNDNREWTAMKMLTDMRIMIAIQDQKYKKNTDSSIQTNKKHLKRL